jgi:hypothetical protein
MGVPHLEGTKSAVLLLAAIIFLSFSLGVVTSDNVEKLLYTYGDNDMVVKNKTVVLLSDPTLEQLNNFLKKDKTDEKEYDKKNYDCTEFTHTFINNFSREGFRSHFVAIDWKNKKPGHDIVGVNLKDGGFVFVEPQTDSIVDVYPGLNWDNKTVKDVKIL